MKVITALDEFNNHDYDGQYDTGIKCFLAGGITGCQDWQQTVISQLEEYDRNNNNILSDLVVFNPRRKNFPIDDPAASLEQIKWEFKHIELTDIFSMFFADNAI